MLIVDRLIVNNLKRKNSSLFLINNIQYGS
jgi:hypothetical protein